VDSRAGSAGARRWTDAPLAQVLATNGRAGSLASVDLNSAIGQWRDGEQRLRAVTPERGVVYERVISAIVAQLRRRLGGRFTAAELVALYAAGTDWYLQLAATSAPDQPWAWDARIVVDAAFARYLREAADYAGGKLTDSRKT
jgi:hypothetical protein